MAIDIKDEQEKVEAVVEETAQETLEEEISDMDETETAEEMTEEEDADEEDDDSADDEELAEDGEDGKVKTKKGLFGKKKDKRDKRDEKIDELTELLKRNMAEFDNFRKRTEKEKASMYEIGARSVVEKLLPVVDNFERGFASVKEEEKAENSFVNGMDMVYKQLLKMLEDMGVEPIEAVGKEFDPNLHNAVMHIDDENLGENVVAQEFQKGYTYKGTVVRHSMVQVAN